MNGQQRPNWMAGLAIFAVVGWLAQAQTNSSERRPFRVDDPVWKMPAPLPVQDARLRKISDIIDLFWNEFGGAGEPQPKKGPPISARGVNTMGEVPDSEWYVNRHYYHPMTVQQLVRGPGVERPPAEGPWTVVAAKSEGVTPGFTIKDTAGRRYVVKFDPSGFNELATGADVVSSKFFHALGYYVPENYIVQFQRERLQIGEETTLLDSQGRKRKMTAKDLGEIFLKVPRLADGSYRGLASLYLSGKPVGPHRYHDTRRDDPNDTIPHEHRRDLRGLRVFCAWLGHDDSRSINSLDLLINEGGVPHIRHYLVDFGSTLGSASTGINSPRSGFVPFFSWSESTREFFTLGLYVPGWMRAHYPDLPSVGRFEYEKFDAERWTPEYRNPAFANMLPDDAFWGAKQIMAFTDEQIRAMVQTGQYSDARAVDWLTKCLIERRNKVGQAFFQRVLPLDRFRVEQDQLRFDDLAAHHGFAAGQAAYTIAWSTYNNQELTAKPITGATGVRVPDNSAEYTQAEISRPDRAQQTVRVYLRRKAGQQEVIGVERTW